jgi:hypothetical protein
VKSSLSSFVQDLGGSMGAGSCCRSAPSVLSPGSWSPGLTRGSAGAASSAGSAVDSVTSPGAAVVARARGLSPPPSGERSCLCRCPSAGAACAAPLRRHVSKDTPACPLAPRFRARMEPARPLRQYRYLRPWCPLRLFPHARCAPSPREAQRSGERGGVRGRLGRPSPGRDCGLSLVPSPRFAGRGQVPRRRRGSSFRRRGL